MIVDTLANSYLYTCTQAMQRAFDYLTVTDFKHLEPGRYELDGKELYVMIQQYNSKTPEQGKWEAHRKYIDIQYIISGSEQIGYANINQLTQGDYNPDKDFLALSGQGNLITMTAGMFMLLYPEDGHMPGMAIDQPVPVKKAVVKVAV